MLLKVNYSVLVYEKDRLDEPKVVFNRITNCLDAKKTAHAFERAGYICVIKEKINNVVNIIHEF